MSRNEIFPSIPFPCVILPHYFAVLKQPDHNEANKSIFILTGQILEKLIPCNT